MTNVNVLNTENEKTTLNQEINMKDLVAKTIREMKKHIKNHSKPAPKDEKYGNKLTSYLNEYDFAVYALLRDADFSKGLHSEEKAFEIKKNLLNSVSKHDCYRNVKQPDGTRVRVPAVREGESFTIFRILDDLNMEGVDREELSELNKYIVSKL